MAPTSSHAYMTQKHLEKLPITSAKLSDRIPKSCTLDRRFKVQMEHRPEAIARIATLPPDSWQIFTDGSKRNQRSGAGFCVLHRSQEVHRASYSLGVYPDIGTCELFALNMAAHWSNVNIQTPASIFFLSDSQTAIKAVHSTYTESDLVRDTISTMNLLGIRHRVAVHWVPGHEQVPGNERADELARAGSDITPIGPEPFLPFTIGNSKREIRDYFLSLHLKQYKNNTLSEKGKEPLTLYLKHYRYQFNKLPGHHLRWLTWLLTGHSPLAYFQFRSNQEASPFCEHCPEEHETSEHFLCYCVGYMTIRLRNFGACTLTLDAALQLKLSTIIKYITDTGSFLTHSDLHQD